MKILLLLIFIIIIIIYMYNCGKKFQIDDKYNQEILDKMAKGCLYRLRAITREELATKEDIFSFMSSGDKKLVIITKISPEDFVNQIYSNQQYNLNAVAISSAVVSNKKNYIVMSLENGKFNPVGSPTENFDDAFNYLNNNTRKILGDDKDTIVFYIDEDVPCPSDVTPLMLLHDSNKEKCCGKMY
jgi:hypothetical protein